jgi:hypothetical protein
MVGWDDAVRIGLRRPDVVVDRLGERLARGIELEDRDHLARLRLLDQVVIVKAPRGRDVGTEAAAGMAGIAARARPDVEDTDLQDIAGLGVLDRHRTGQKMNADAFAGAALERTFDRPRAAADYRFVLPGPVKDALGAGIVGDHPLIIVIGMMRQRFDGGAVAGLQRQGRLGLLAEVAPLDVGGRNGKEMVLHAMASANACGRKFVWSEGTASDDAAGCRRVMQAPRSVCRPPSR